MMKMADETRAPLVTPGCVWVRVHPVHACTNRCTCTRTHTHRRTHAQAVRQGCVPQIYRAQLVCRACSMSTPHLLDKPGDEMLERPLCLVQAISPEVIKLKKMIAAKAEEARTLHASAYHRTCVHTFVGSFPIQRLTSTNALTQLKGIGATRAEQNEAVKAALDGDGDGAGAV